MEPTQGNTNNQNNIGISGFGSALPNNSIPPKPTPPMPASNPTPTANTPVPQTGSIQVQNTPTPPAPNPIPMAPPPMPPVPPAPTMPKAPVAPMNIQAGGQNLSDKALVGGVSQPQPKRKFTLPFQKNKEKVGVPPVSPVPTTPTAPVTPPPAVPPATPAYNEVTAPGKKNQMAMIAIAAGVVLLLAAAGGYYYLNFMNKPEVPAVQEPVEVTPAVIEDSVMEQDPYIIQLIQLESTASAEPATLMKHLNSIELDGINQELMPETTTRPITTTGDEDTLPAPEAQPGTPIP